MKVGVVILCRYASSRLPGKILKEIEGISILDRIVAGVSTVTDKYVVATSEESSDDIIEQHCMHNAIPVFRGSLDNVAERFYQAAENQKWDYAIRINGDNLFVNTRVLQQMLSLDDLINYDLLSNVPGRTYPYGMSVEMIRLSFYKSQMSNFSTWQKEHVTLYFYDNPELGIRHIIEWDDAVDGQRINLAIDTQEDFDKAVYILNKAETSIAKMSIKELVTLALEFENRL